MLEILFDFLSFSRLMKDYTGPLDSYVYLRWVLLGFDLSLCISFYFLFQINFSFVQKRKKRIQKRILCNLVEYFQVGSLTSFGTNFVSIHGKFVYLDLLQETNTLRDGYTNWSEQHVYTLKDFLRFLFFGFCLWVSACFLNKRACKILSDAKSSHVQSASGALLKWFVQIKWIYFDSVKLSGKQG